MNMITRTCSQKFSQKRIYMNSVDTGWITNEFPFDKTQDMADQGFQPPLDDIDGAAPCLAIQFFKQSSPTNPPTGSLIRTTAKSPGEVARKARNRGNAALDDLAENSQRPRLSSPVSHGKFAEKSAFEGFSPRLLAFLAASGMRIANHCC